MRAGEADPTDDASLLDFQDEAADTGFRPAPALGQIRIGQQRLTLHVGVVDDRHMLRAGDCRIVEDGVQPKVHDGIQLAEDQLTFLASSSQ